MSFAPLGGIVGSIAGAPLSQTKGASEERAARDAATQQMSDELDLQAEKSSGIGQTEGDSETSDRDADGRRQWERMDRKPPDDEQDASGKESSGSATDDPASDGLDLIA